jgi:hypothetical protein
LNEGESVEKERLPFIKAPILRFHVIFTPLFATQKSDITILLDFCHW